MTKQDVIDGLRAIVEQYGPFVAQNMRLADGVYTIDEKANYDHFKLNRVKQIVSDLGLLRPGVRLLDIASLKSMFAIEFALEGLEVVSIEGREANIERGKFAARALGANTVHFHQDDVNNISQQKYGQFEVILCMGILYHIAKDRYLDFLKHVTECCSDLLIVDSFVSVYEDDFLERDGTRFPGITWREFEVGVPLEDIEKSSHSSLNNSLSFSMTKPALIDYLSKLGFTTITEVQTPRQPGQPRDRPTLVCRKGKPVSIRVFPEFDYHGGFAKAADTRGTHGQDLIFWNRPKEGAGEKTSPPGSFDERSRIGKVLRSMLRGTTIESIGRLIRRGLRR